jgi:DNA-binding transcriptional regulator LsrR (DeoR family)
MPRKKYDLKHVEVVPSDPVSGSTTVGIAEAAAAEIERWLKKRPIRSCSRSERAER